MLIVGTGRRGDYDTRTAGNQKRRKTGEWFSHECGFRHVIYEFLCEIYLNAVNFV